MTEDCRRPDIPTIAWFALAVWIGSAACERLLCDGIGWSLLPFALGASFGLVSRRHRTLVLLVAVGLVTGAALSGGQWLAIRQQRMTVGACGAREWTGVVEADPMPAQFGGVVRIRIVGGPLDHARVRVSWPQDAPLPSLGRQVRFAVVLKPLPMEEVWARRLQRGGVCASGNAWRVETGEWRPGPLGPLYAWREGVLEQLHLLPGPGGDLAEGIVLGDRRRLLGTPAEQDFQVLGLTHLVAVSGSHLALACGAVAFIGMLVRVPKRVLVPATVLAGAAYAIVTGLPFSALRSLLMLVVVAIGQLLGRRGSGIASLGAAVIAVLALEPWAVYDLGLQLSVLAVGSLLLFGALATSWVRAGLPERLRVLGEPLGLTLVAQVATIPVVASAFGMVSVLAPVANALAGACVSVALLLGLGAAVLLPPARGLALVALRLCCTVLAATAAGAEVLAATPGAAVAVNGGLLLATLTVAAFGALWVRWPLPQGRVSGTRVVAGAVAVSLALALGPAPPQRCELVVLDVGQGDAILVRDGGRAMLVDAGPNALSLRQALARTGVRRIDVVVLTHAHDDHTGGLSALPAVVELGWVGVSALAPEQPPVGGAPVRRLHAGDTWTLGETRVRVVWPPESSDEELSTNNTSVVLEVQRGSFDAVLTGDAEDAAQQGMASSGDLHDVEVLKVPHHGSRNGLAASALEVWSPEVALISVGAHNDFGHPSAETIALLREASVRTARTDYSGDLTISVNDRGYRLTTARTVTVRARMDASLGWPGTSFVPAWTARSGSGSKGQDDRGSQAGLPHLRRGRTASRARPPPAARSRGRGGRSRLQLRGIRRRQC